MATRHLGEAVHVPTSLATQRPPLPLTNSAQAEPAGKCSLSWPGLVLLISSAALLLLSDSSRATLGSTPSRLKCGSFAGPGMGPDLGLLSELLLGPAWTRATALVCIAFAVHQTFHY